MAQKQSGGGRTSDAQEFADRHNGMPPKPVSLKKGKVYEG